MIVFGGQKSKLRIDLVSLQNYNLYKPVCDKFHSKSCYNGITRISIDKRVNVVIQSTEQMFAKRCKGGQFMTDNEKELLRIILEHDNPERAVEIAINLAIDFSTRHEAPQGTSSVHHRESA